MDALDVVLDELLAARDTPAARRLARDGYAVALERGEAAGVALARAVLAGARELNFYESELARKRDCASAGKVLGEKKPPVEGEWWALLDDGDVVPSDDRRAVEAAYWCVDASGWWRVPGAVRVVLPVKGKKKGARGGGELFAGEDAA